jgi:tetratricopeptide (TPR) repeat protein
VGNPSSRRWGLVARLVCLVMKLRKYLILFGLSGVVLLFVVSISCFLTIRCLQSTGVVYIRIPQTTSNADELYASGTTYLRERRYASALLCFYRSHELEPSNPRARLFLAMSLYLLGENNSAQNLLREDRDYSNTDDSMIESLYMSLEAALLGDSGKTEKALDLARAAETASKGRSRYNRNVMSSLFLQAGLVDEAVNFGREAIRNESSSDDSIVYLADALHRQGNESESRDVLSAILKKEPEHIDTYNLTTLLRLLTWDRLSDVEKRILIEIEKNCVTLRVQKAERNIGIDPAWERSLTPFTLETLKQRQKEGRRVTS